MKVLILFAHPALERSRVNRRLLREVADVPGVTCHDLYEAYPDLHIDVKHDQDLLLRHDVVVFQSPFYWYAAPAIVKEWQDLVLAHGWAYGAGGTALRGKTTFNVLTAGGPQNSYAPAGHNRFAVRTLLAPFEATANLCGMRFLAPFVVFGVLRFAADSDYEAATRGYRKLLEAITRNKFDFDRAAELDLLLPHLDDLILPTPQATGEVA